MFLQRLRRIVSSLYYRQLIVCSKMESSSSLFEFDSSIPGYQENRVLYDTYNVIYIRDWVEFSVAMLSLFSSLFTLFVIRQLKAWNGNILLIITLTSFQILYDINFLFGPSEYYETCVIWNFLDILGGLGTSFTTNVIAFTMVYVVVKVRSINVIQNYKYFMLIVGLVPLVFATLTLFTVEPASKDDDKPYTTCVFNGSVLAHVIQNFYYWSRLASIILNFLAFMYISFKIKRLGFGRLVSVFQRPRAFSTTSSRSTDHSPAVLTLSEQQTLAVRILATRMRFYPLAQAICRSGSAWDEFENYKYSNNTSSLMASACSPLSGVFYMLIFLVRFLLLLFSFFRSFRLFFC
jgi:hypothetical protein